MANADLAGDVAAASFAFNGWGGKYDLPGDAEVSMRVAATSGLRTFRDELVLEGGSVEPDGEGYRIDGAYRCRYLIGAGGTRCPVYRDLFRAGQELCQTCDTDAMLITLGAEGMALFQKEQSFDYPSLLKRLSRQC